MIDAKDAEYMKIRQVLSDTARKVRHFAPQVLHYEGIRKQFVKVLIEQINQEMERSGYQTKQRIKIHKAIMAAAESEGNRTNSIPGDAVEHKPFWKDLKKKSTHHHY